jgi:hypothetical protein
MLSDEPRRPIWTWLLIDIFFKITRRIITTMLVFAFFIVMSERKAPPSFTGGFDFYNLGYREKLNRDVGLGFRLKLHGLRPA